MTDADFIRQLKLIVAHHEFHPVEGEDNIYSVGGETGEDYSNLLNAARKAVEHGYQVFISIDRNLACATTYFRRFKKHYEK